MLIKLHSASCLNSPLFHLSPRCIACDNFFPLSFIFFMAGGHYRVVTEPLPLILICSDGINWSVPFRTAPHSISFQSRNLLDHRSSPLMPCHISALIQWHIPSMVVLPTTWLDFPILLLLAITSEPLRIDFLFFIFQDMVTLTFRWLDVILSWM